MYFLLKYSAFLGDIREFSGVYLKPPPTNVSLCEFCPLTFQPTSYLKETAGLGLSRFHRLQLTKLTEKTSIFSHLLRSGNRPQKTMPEKTPNSQSYGMTWCQNSAFFAFIQAGSWKRKSTQQSQKSAIHAISDGSGSEESQDDASTGKKGKESYKEFA